MSQLCTKHEQKRLPNCSWFSFENAEIVIKLDRLVMLISDGKFWGMSFFVAFMRHSGTLLDPAVAFGAHSRHPRGLLVEFHRSQIGYQRNVIHLMGFVVKTFKTTTNSIKPLPVCLEYFPAKKPCSVKPDASGFILRNLSRAFTATVCLCECVTTCNLKQLFLRRSSPFLAKAYHESRADGQRIWFALALLGNVASPFVRRQRIFLSRSPE